MGPLIGLAAVSAVTAGGLTWIVAWRYGRARALVVPVLAVAAVALFLGRVPTGDATGGLQAVALAMVYLGPALAGAAVGLLLARR